MFPGMNPRQMNQMMKKMGIQQEEIPATEVIIRTTEGDIIIKNPHVTKVNMMGQMTYQITGEEEKAGTEITNDDVELVAEQAGVSVDYARAALEDVQGDIARAIELLKKS
jgi:nascent polypeptide-associated complex subunit alpha